MKTSHLYTSLSIYCIKIENESKFKSKIRIKRFTLCELALRNLAIFRSNKFNKINFYTHSLNFS